MDDRESSTSSRASSHSRQQTRSGEDQKPANGSAPSCTGEALPAAQQQKVTQIRRACRSRDVPALASLAASRDGFVEDAVRREAWPVLMGCIDATTDTGEAWKALAPHRDEEQVEKDVARAFIYYPTDESDKRADERKQQLSDLIVQVLRQHPQLSYFQGYHDIAQVFLLVLGYASAGPAVTRLSLLKIRDFMLPALSPATVHLRLLPAILYAADPALCSHLKPTQPFYALSATLTLYAHDIQEYADIARLFDFLLAKEAVVSIYLYAAIILDRKDELLEIPADDPDMQLFRLSKLPQPLDLERLIEQATYLFENHPPESLPFGAWRRVSRNSVLKTTRDAANVSQQTLDEGERLFANQEAELRRQQWLDGVRLSVRKSILRHRRPMIFTVAAVAVGVVALWLGGNPELVSRRIMSSPLLKGIFGDFTKALRGRFFRLDN